MIHGPLLAMGLGEPFSFSSERTKLFCLKLLVLLTRYENLLNDMVISVPSELKQIFLTDDVSLLHCTLPTHSSAVSS